MHGHHRQKCMPPRGRLHVQAAWGRNETGQVVRVQGNGSGMAEQKKAVPTRNSHCLEGHNNKERRRDNKQGRQHMFTAQQKNRMAHHTEDTRGRTTWNL